MATARTETGISDLLPSATWQKAREDTPIGDWRTALVVALVVSLSALATVPFAGLAMNDDASYAHSAREFAEHGRFIYNGWGTPILIPQILYGAAIIKVFGFSYLALDVSGILFGGVCGALMYLLCRACRLERNVSIIATGILLLNPISLAIMPSFMTELPSLALLLGALLFLVHAVKRVGESYRIHTGRLAISVALAILAGSNRQPCWAAYLGALVPVLWRFREDRRLLAVAAGALLMSAAFLTLWFARQPFAASPPIGGIALASLRFPMRPLLNTYELLNLASLVGLPLLLLLIRPHSFSRIQVLKACIFSLLLCALPIDHKVWAERGEYLTVSGVGVILVENQWQDPALFELIVRFLLRAAGGIVLAFAFLTLTRWWRSRETGGTGKRADLLATMMLSSSAMQLAVLIPWFSYNYVFDRYLMGLLPCGLVFVGLCIKGTIPGCEVSLRLGRARAALLALWGLSLAFAWDYMRYTDARKEAYGYLASKGIDRDRFDGGIEFNNDTQLRMGGQLHSPLVKNRGKIVAIRPAYYLTTTPTVEWARTIVDQRIQYTNIIPPFRKQLFLLKVVGRPVSDLRTR